jgi:hypothetical protein
MMAPTVFRQGAFRFYFFSREETRMHVHLSHPDGEAKFWLEPQVALAQSRGLTPLQLAAAERLVTAHRLEIEHAWRRHFQP